MKANTHINVTIDFNNWNGGIYDLRIPIHQTIKQLFLNLQETLKIAMPHEHLFIVKITTKHLLLADEDILWDYPVANGDILVVY